MKRNVLIEGIILTLAYLAQIGVTIYRYQSAPLAWLQNAGFGVMMLSAVFGWWPIPVMRRWGDVEEGKGYIHTRQLVDHGPYALVRHPQYLAGILMTIGLSLMAQHWLAVALGLIAAWATWYGLRAEEADCLQKFGTAYTAYADRVPQLNFLTGLARWLGRRRKTN
ncbi:MAG: isoprenylcysteine carboxylmethyltransferase family protein [Anaerolineales bacterium]|nr:isoprenylcysteine carboxylmethyltransferase family protein [Anaerolineales bacterium]